MSVGERTEPKEGVMRFRGPTQRQTRQLSKNPLAFNRKSLGCKRYLNKKLTTFLKA
jgi:hypothetical protein